MAKLVDVSALLIRCTPTVGPKDLCVQIKVAASYNIAATQRAAGNYEHHRYVL